MFVANILNFVSVVIFSTKIDIISVLRLQRRELAFDTFEVISHMLKVTFIYFTWNDLTDVRLTFASRRIWNKPEGLSTSRSFWTLQAESFVANIFDFLSNLLNTTSGLAIHNGYASVNWRVWQLTCVLAGNVRARTMRYKRLRMLRIFSSLSYDKEEEDILNAYVA